MAPASTSLASAWVGMPKPGTSMPMIRTPLISLGRSCSGTPEAVGTHRLVTIDRVVERGVGELEDRVADVLEQLAGDQRLGVERDVADGPPRAVEMGGEGQAVDAAGAAREHRRRAPHPQADAQRAERRAHALRLVVRSLRIVRRVALEDRPTCPRRRRPRASCSAPPWQPRSPSSGVRGGYGRCAERVVHPRLRPRRRRLRGDGFSTKAPPRMSAWVAGVSV